MYTRNRCKCIKYNIYIYIYKYTYRRTRSCILYDRLVCVCDLEIVVCIQKKGFYPELSTYLMCVNVYVCVCECGKRGGRTYRACREWFSCVFLGRLSPRKINANPYGTDRNVFHRSNCDRRKSQGTCNGFGRTYVLFLNSNINRVDLSRTERRSGLKPMAVERETREEHL